MTTWRLRSARAARAGLIAGVALVALGPSSPARAQAKTTAPAAGPDLTVPGFWDPRRRPERPDLTRIAQIRFLTENDYPPFNFPGPDGSPAGFNVDLARMICEALKVTCTIQARRFDTLIAALGDNHGDAIIASLSPSPALRRGEVDLLFGDGIQLAFWLNGTDSGNCCEFRGGPFTESRYFGEGVGIAVRRGNDTLRQAFNWALFGLWEKGRFTDLWLRY